LAFAVSDALNGPFNERDTNSTKNAKIYYKSCLNESKYIIFNFFFFLEVLIKIFKIESKDKLEEDGEAELVKFIKNKLGGWSYLDSSVSVTKETVFQRLNAFAKYAHRPLFSFALSTNPKSPAQYTLRLQQATWFYSKDRYDDEKFVAAYKTFSTSMLKQLKSFLRQDFDAKMVDDIFNLEKELSSVNMASSFRVVSKT
jgi:hypothetical protein